MGFTRRQEGALVYFTGDNISVPHAFTTRLGGVSRDHLAALNLGFHRGDDPQRVLENYRILCAALGTAPEQVAAAHQIHSDIVLPVGPEELGAGVTGPRLPECDALVTATPGAALVVFTADCTPILLWDPVTGAVGAVHAGWRGTAQDIGGKTVEAMARLYGCRRENIRAAIGPNIGPCCFETGPEVPQAMVAQLGPGAEEDIRPMGKKYYVNLKTLNAKLLRRAGVENLEVSPLCTACRTDLFWSARRMGDARGSQGAMIRCMGGIQ